MSPHPAGPTRVVPFEKAAVVRAFGEEVHFLLRAAETNGAYTLFLELTPPGGGPPPHFHQREDEWFTVLEGRVSFFGDGHWTEVGPGGAFFAPRGAVHTYRNDGPSPARMLVQTSPSGIESFFDAAAAEFARPGGPDMEKAMGIAAAHGIEFV